MSAWSSGSALAAINKVILRQARLVVGWVTVCGQINHLGILLASQVITAWPCFCG